MGVGVAGAGVGVSPGLEVARCDFKVTSPIMPTSRTMTANATYTSARGITGFGGGVAGTGAGAGTGVGGGGG